MFAWHSNSPTTSVGRRIYGEELASLVFSSTDMEAHNIWWGVKVDLSKFGNWEDSPEKMMLSLVSNPNKPEREER